MNICAHIDYSRGIYGFFEAHRFLSNFFPLEIPVRLLGYDFFHAENAYQAAKSQDTEVHRAFACLDNPDKCKILGGTLAVREDWPAIKDFVMFEILRQKFSKNPHLLQALLGTGNSYLEESNWWGDNYWGCCIGDKDYVLSHTHTANSLLGKNKLGHALMTLREMLHYTHQSVC